MEPVLIPALIGTALYFSASIFAYVYARARWTEKVNEVTLGGSFGPSFLVRLGAFAFLNAMAAAKAASTCVGIPAIVWLAGIFAGVFALPLQISAVLGLLWAVKRIGDVFERAGAFAADEAGE